MDQITPTPLITAINGGDFSDSLKNSLTTAGISIASSYAYGAIGDMGLKEGNPVKAIFHAAAGGISSELLGGSFEAGALAGFVTEITAPAVSASFDTEESRVAAAKLIGAITALSIAEDAGDIELAAKISGDIRTYNHEVLTHVAKREFRRLIEKAQTDLDSPYKDVQYKDIVVVLDRFADAHKGPIIEIAGLDPEALEFVINHPSLVENTVVTDENEREGIMKGIANFFGGWFEADNAEQQKYMDISETVGTVIDAVTIVPALVKVGGKFVLKQVVKAGDEKVSQWSPEVPTSADGNPIVRSNDRGSIETQPNGSVTCGQHACGMVLNTLGKPVAVDDLIKQVPGTNEGTTTAELVSLLSNNNVISTAHTKIPVNQLNEWTSNGTPAIAMVRSGSDTLHHIVVDGITQRNGQTVIAIRDPAKGSYYETIESFQNRFVGNAVRIVK